MILSFPVADSSSVCIWLCHPVLLAAKQYGGKMVAKQRLLLEKCQGASEGQEGGF